MHSDRKSRTWRSVSQLAPMSMTPCRDPLEPTRTHTTWTRRRARPLIRSVTLSCFFLTRRCPSDSGDVPLHDVGVESHHTGPGRPSPLAECRPPGLRWRVTRCGLRDTGTRWCAAGSSSRAGLGHDLAVIPPLGLSNNCRGR